MPRSPRGRPVLQERLLRRPTRQSPSAMRPEVVHQEASVLGVVVPLSRKRPGVGPEGPR